MKTLTMLALLTLAIDFCGAARAGADEWSEPSVHFERLPSAGA